MVCITNLILVATLPLVKVTDDDTHNNLQSILADRKEQISVCPVKIRLPPSSDRIQLSHSGSLMLTLDKYTPISLAALVL